MKLWIITRILKVYAGRNVRTDSLVAVTLVNITNDERKKNVSYNNSTEKSETVIRQDLNVWRKTRRGTTDER